MATEALLEGSLDKICKRVEEEALNGNMQAAKMILDRFIPVRKDRIIKIDLPMIIPAKSQSKRGSTRIAESYSNTPIACFREKIK